MASPSCTLFISTSLLLWWPGCCNACVQDQCDDLSDEMSKPTQAQAMLQKSMNKKLKTESLQCIDNDALYNSYTYTNTGCAALKQLTPGSCAKTCDEHSTVKEACCASCSTCAANVDICPSSCQSPQCNKGSSWNGGLDLIDGKCTQHCSMHYSGVRYCGSGHDYTIGPSVDCTGCALGCPSECQSPVCVKGGSHNGGIALISGKCTSHCSQSYAGVRYCGAGDEYTVGGINCAGCKTSEPEPEPEPTTCPSSCANPSCVKGASWNGGFDLTDGKCNQYCSQPFNGVRYCGLGGEYSAGGIDCRGCGSTKCPSACESPVCGKGASWNGGIELTNGKCTSWCSKPYNGARYCGNGAKYSGADSIDCSGCADTAYPGNGGFVPPGYYGGGAGYGSGSNGYGSGY
mmetsp:Transcript_136809/g.249382  ORF Transcript_136809/g.249382 Transcript_136809/m.249382 type:complete len:402 (+) Transcript_136809:83-1288(+)